MNGSQTIHVFGSLRIFIFFEVMTDHKEEQELELEALSSIYPEEFCRELEMIPC